VSRSACSHDAIMGISMVCKYRFWQTNTSLYVFEKQMYDTKVKTEDTNMNMKELLVDT